MTPRVTLGSRTVELFISSMLEPHGLEEVVAMAIEAVGPVGKARLRAKNLWSPEPQTWGRKEPLRSSVQPLQP